MKGRMAVAVAVACAVSAGAWAITIHRSFRGGYPVGVAGRAGREDASAVLSAPKSAARKDSVRTNVVVAARCWAVTAAGERCRRPAAKGKRYCRAHVATAVPKKPPSACRSMTKQGVPCKEPPLPNRNYCELHAK